MSTIRVLAAVVRRGDSYLVCQRPLSKRHGGLWEFPGGKCEEGETDEQAARRELKEELNVDLEWIDPELFVVQDPGSPFLIAFVPVGIRGTPECLEHAALGWMTLTAASALPLAPSDRRFVEFMLSRKPHETPTDPTEPGL